MGRVVVIGRSCAAVLRDNQSFRHLLFCATYHPDFGPTLVARENLEENKGGKVHQLQAYTATHVTWRWGPRRAAAGPENHIRLGVDVRSVKG